MICLNFGMATLLAGVVAAAPLMRVLPKWCFENVCFVGIRDLPEFPVGTHFSGNFLP
jgi:hypothetical protein